MRFPAICAAIFLLCATAAPADGPQQYVIRQNVSVGQSFKVRLDIFGRGTSALTVGGKTAESQVKSHQFILLTYTVVAANEGVPTEVSVDIDPDSHNTVTDSDGMKIWDNAFAGRTISARRLPDGQWIDAVFNGYVDSPDHTNVLSPLFAPQMILPDHPVAIGDIWEPKPQRGSRIPPGQQLMAQCQLDSVLDRDGKQIAQISLSLAAIQHSRNDVEIDMEDACTYRLDLATGQVVSWDRSASSTFSNPESNAHHVTGTWTSHDLMTAQALPTPSTQP
jgi:hypothetical protein